VLQRRTCTNGTTDICTVHDIIRFIDCNLADCPKELGPWTNSSACTPKAGKTCGPNNGDLTQSRTCTSGTTDLCMASDRSRTIDCNLADCPKELGPWTNSSACTPKAGKTCGPNNGDLTQNRTCTSGTTDLCMASDTSRTIDCNLADCPKELGPWMNISDCTLKAGKTCGPNNGHVLQRRTCTNGTTDICTVHDIIRFIDCNLADCPKELGPWTNSSACTPKAGKTCGPNNGDLTQSRTCTSGTTDLCMASDTSRTIHCDLPNCPIDGGYNLWTEWSQCTSNCDHVAGQQVRKRFCRYPEPMFGGRTCVEQFGPTSAREVRTCMGSIPRQTTNSTAACYDIGS